MADPITDAFSAIDEYLEEIEEIMKHKGKTEIVSSDHKFFTSGKTSFTDHKEFLFITKAS